MVNTQTQLANYIRHYV